MILQWIGSKCVPVLPSKVYSEESVLIEEKRRGTFKLLLDWFVNEDKPERNEAKELMELINTSRKQWNEALTNYEYAEGKDMVDYYIFHIKACQIKYEYLIKRAKGVGLKG